MAITTLTQTTQQQRMGRLGESSSVSVTYIAECNSDMNTAEILVDPVVPIVRVTRWVHDVSYVCVAIDVEHVSPRVWRVSVEYFTRSNPTFVAPVRMTRRVSSRPVDIWVMPSSLPVNGVAVWPPTASVVAGDRLDIYGQPEQVMSWQHDITLEVSWDTTLLTRDQNGPDYYSLIWLAAMNQRNSVTYLGYTPGTLVFLGWTEAMADDPWVTASLSFRADYYLHLQQRVLPHVDGRPLLTQSSTWDGSPIKHVHKAYWYQPYQRYGLSNFAAIWDLSEWQNPTPVYPP